MSFRWPSPEGVRSRVPMARLAVVVVAVVVAVVGVAVTAVLVGLPAVAAQAPRTPPPASPSPSPSACTAQAGGGAIGAGCATGGAGGEGEDGEEDDLDAGPRYRYRYVLTCLGNTLDTPNDTLCQAATTTCDAPAYLYWQYRSLDGVAWRMVGTRCMTPAEAAAGEAFPGFTLADFERLPLPAGDVVLEPGNGYALTQVPLNLIAVAGVTVLPTQLAGFAVTVRATPVSWTWDLGDGTVVTTSDPGAPYPALDVTHTYTTSGSYAVTLTTTYAGEFSVDGGAFAPVTGVAEVASAPVPVAVLQGRGALVQDTLG